MPDHHVERLEWARIQIEPYLILNGTIIESCQNVKILIVVNLFYQYYLTPATFSLTIWSLIWSDSVRATGQNPESAQSSWNPTLHVASVCRKDLCIRLYRSDAIESSSNESLHGFVSNAIGRKIIKKSFPGFSMSCIQLSWNTICCISTSFVFFEIYNILLVPTLRMLPAEVVAMVFHMGKYFEYIHQAYPVCAVASPVPALIVSGAGIHSQFFRTTDTRRI